MSPTSTQLLPHRQFRALRDLESPGYEEEEFAGIMDILDGAVKSRLHRARMAWRNLLEPLLD